MELVVSYLDDCDSGCGFRLNELFTYWPVLVLAQLFVHYAVVAREPLLMIAALVNMMMP